MPRARIDFVFSIVVTIIFIFILLTFSARSSTVLATGKYGHQQQHGSNSNTADNTGTSVTAGGPSSQMTRVEGTQIGEIDRLRLIEDSTTAEHPKELPLVSTSDRGKAPMVSASMLPASSAEMKDAVIEVSSLTGKELEPADGGMEFVGRQQQSGDLPPAEAENVFDQDVEKKQKFEKFHDQSALHYLQSGGKWICPEKELDKLDDGGFERFWWNWQTLHNCKQWMELEWHTIRWLRFLNIWQNRSMPFVNIYQSSATDMEDHILHYLSAFPAVLSNWKSTTQRNPTAKVVMKLVRPSKFFSNMRKENRKLKKPKDNGKLGENNKIFTAMGLVLKLRQQKVELQWKYAEALQKWEEAAKSKQQHSRLTLPPPKWRNADVCRKVEKLVTFYRGEVGFYKHNPAIGTFLQQLLHTHKDVLWGIESQLTLPKHLAFCLRTVSKGKERQHHSSLSPSDNKRKRTEEEDEETNDEYEKWIKKKQRM